MSHIDNRDDLLDWAWLDRVYKRDGIDAFGLRLRKGAEEYGSPVAAIADAVVSPGRDYHVKDGCDLQLDASLKILWGSWSLAPEGPHQNTNPLPVARSSGMFVHARRTFCHRTPDGSLLATVSLPSETSPGSHLCVWTFPALPPPRGHQGRLLNKGLRRVRGRWHTCPGVHGRPDRKPQ